MKSQNKILSQKIDLNNDTKLKTDKLVNMEQQNKILIISHNAMLSTNNNGRTMSELFNWCDKDNIAQLFFHKDIPDADFCDNYFRVTDFDIKDSVLRLKKAGSKIEKETAKSQNEAEKAVYGNNSAKKPLVRLLRNLAWGLNTWKTKALKNWLKDFSPNVIFFYGSDAVFSLKIAMWVSKFCCAPIVCYWVDDFYFSKNMDLGAIGKLNHKIYKRVTKKLISSSKNVCLTELMAHDYELEFGVKCETLYTTSSMTEFIQRDFCDPIKLSFVGNISWNRYKSIIDIANIIREKKLAIDFSVYTAEDRAWILDNIKNVEALNYKGRLEYSEVKKTMEQSDVLLHVEAFDAESIEGVKYSFSTKIADSLSSGKPLLAYGPKNVASIDFLLRNQCAMCATSKSELEQCLIKIASSKNLKEIREKQLNVAKIYHNKNKNIKQIQQILQNTIDKKIEKEGQ